MGRFPLAVTQGPSISKLFHAVGPESMETKSQLEKSVESVRENLFIFHYRELGHVAPPKSKETEKLGPQLGSYFPVTTSTERKEYRFLCGQQADCHRKHGAQGI